MVCEISKVRTLALKIDAWPTRSCAGHNNGNFGIFSTIVRRTQTTRSLLTIPCDLHREESGEIFQKRMQPDAILPNQTKS